MRHLQLTFTRSIFAACLLVLAPAAALAALFGHHHSNPTGPCPTAVVLDFSVAPRVQEKRDCCTRRLGYNEKELVTEKDYRGWWLGKQILYFNANVGRMAADIFSETIRDNGLYAITSREDLKYYYADKRDLISSKLKLKGNALEKALLELDPVMIGREMGVDKVIVGHICDSELRKGMGIGSFASVVSMNVAIFDVKSGTLDWDKCYIKRRNHSTQYFHYEEIAEEFSEDVRHLRGGTMVPVWSGR